MSGRDESVRIDEEENIPARRACPGITHRCNLAIMDGDNNGAGRLRDLSRRIGGTVVDYDDLVRLHGRSRGRTNSGQSAWEIALLIVGWNDKRKHRTQTVAAVHHDRIRRINRRPGTAVKGPQPSTNQMKFAANE